MKIYRLLGLGFVGSLLVGGGCLAFPGCGSSSDSGGSKAANAPGAVPKKPDAPPTTSTAGHTYALHKFYLGDTERSGASSRDAWRKIGYNLDGKDTTSVKDTDVCRNKTGNVVDGDQGIDNAFGSNILPILLSINANLSASFNDALAQGKAGGMIDIVGIDDNAIPQTNTALKAQVFAAGAFSEAGAPTWTTTDDWPVRRELLVGGTLAGGSQVRFDDAWIDHGKFVSGETAKIVLNLAAFGETVQLAIYRGVIVFDHNAKGKAVNGTIAGVLKTEELVDVVRKLAGRINKSFCPGSTVLENIITNLRTASDMLVDGALDPSKDCDGISIGLGFDADEIGRPTRLADPAGPAPPDPCLSDAGTD